MSSPIRWKLAALGAFALAAIDACVGGVGYTDVGVGVGYVGGYYEPGGYDYGGWGGNYWVGPPRGGHGPWTGGGHDGHPGHGAPPGRSAPSIPSQPHGGGGGQHR
jgi:hypothetical protein